MNKTITIFLIFSLLSTKTNSQQIKYSFELNSNIVFLNETGNYYLEVYSPSAGYSSLTYSVVENEAKARLGMSINNQFSIKLNKRFSFNTGINFQFLNITQKYVPDKTIPNDYRIPIYNGGNTSLSFEYNYSTYILNVPALLQCNFLKEKLLISTGLSLSALLKEKNNTNVFNYHFFNMVVNLQFKTYKKIYTNLSFSKSITDVKNNSYNFYIPSSNIKTGINNFSLGLSYKF